MPTLAPTPCPPTSNATLGTKGGQVYNRWTFQGLEGATVRYLSENGCIEAETTSRAEGLYRVELPLGRYYVEAFYPGYLAFHTKPGFSVLTGGQQTHNIDLTPEGLTCSTQGLLIPGKSSFLSTEGLENQPPNVTISTHPSEVQFGQPFNVTVVGQDDRGLHMIWWVVEETGIPEPAVRDTVQYCGGATECTKVYSVVMDRPGEYILTANARDAEGRQATTYFPHTCANITVLAATNSTLLI